MNSRKTHSRHQPAIWLSTMWMILFTASHAFAAPPPGAGGGGGGGGKKNPTCTITSPAGNPIQVSSGNSIDFVATAESGSAPYNVIWSLPGSSQNEVQDTITSSGGSSSVSVSYLADGTYTASFEATDAKGSACTDTRTVEVGTAPPPPTVDGGYSVIAANDLGMHCADLDYQIFSILPPFNVIHAQVIQQGTGDTADTLPKLLTNADVDVYYSAVSSDLDPKGAGSVNTTNSLISKTNFWDPSAGFPYGNATNTLGGLAYRSLYPSVLAGALLNPPQDFSGLCSDPSNQTGCPSILDLFEPIGIDVGIPVPDLHKLHPDGGSPELAVDQQHMPGVSNVPQKFARFDVDLPFFVDFPFGYRIQGANWFAADGIPILPIDDNGNDNAYPLMRVQAVSSGDAATPENVLASVDIVLPVASEADCQLCHAVSGDDAMTALGFAGNGAASDLASVNFDTALASESPGSSQLNQLQNAAKINILRLHDVKHGASYESWPDSGTMPLSLVATVCNAGVDPLNADGWNDNCLSKQTPVQCSQCHYSPALDLAHAGPVDEPEQGPRGRQQRHHISQSRAMHGHHGSLSFMGSDLFPSMPAPNDPQRTASQEIMPINAFEQGILEETCYACHPGKNTQCLRGAMFQGGMVCQDCHGDMAQVGDDFTANFPTTPFPAGADLSKRVSWASEPGCQSCHTGDALNPNHPQDAIKAPDDIRLMQAYVDADATPIASPNSRFAENQNLYRLSQGHGGVKCEGCHGSTHAIWPVTPREGPFVANDNLAAIQLQGHDGKLQECDVCHARDSNGDLTMPLGLDGPHGMHPVNDKRWNHQHRNFTGRKNSNCKTCHGPDLNGTVLSATSATRVLDCKNNQGDFPDCAAGNPTAQVDEGTQIGCGNCHRQK